MYITLKSLPVQHTLFNSAPQVKPTLVLPQNKNVEIRAPITNYLFIRSITKQLVCTRKLKSVCPSCKESDVSLTAVTNQKTHGSSPWEQVEDVTKKKILLQKKI